MPTPELEGFELAVSGPSITKTYTLKQLKANFAESSIVTALQVAEISQNVYDFNMKSARATDGPQ